MTDRIIADARPTDGVFLEMFVRDLSLEDCILDLIDNSIDSLIKSRNMDVSEILLPETIREGNNNGGREGLEPAKIEITINSEQFKISDNCGGIGVEAAKNDVFRIGHPTEGNEGQLGVYGIGLKRAIFKIGNDITIESKTVDEGFKMVIDVPNWKEKKEWELPFDVIEGARDPKTAGTSIVIKSYSEEITERLKSGTFETILKEMIERTYCLFLNRYVEVTLNGLKVEPKPIPIGDSPNVNIAKEEFEEKGVKVTIYAGLAGRTEEKEWKQEQAGWYIACNGRLVIMADRNKLTGWGSNLPLFVPKFRGFVGLVLFSSKKPLLLPWTTTKQGINSESLIFQRALTRMAATARPVINFLNSMVSSNGSEKEPQRQAAAEIKYVDMTSLDERPRITFKASPVRIEGWETTVQFRVKDKDLDRIKKHLGKSGWSARKIAQYTFDYYLKTECPE